MSKIAKTRASGRVTIEDVAKRANVSAMTVSRALKNPELVSDELRQRVDDVVSKLGYVPHHAARTLASSKSKLIGVLVPSFSNEVFVAILAGIRDSLQPHGYQLMIGDTQYSRELEQQLFLTYLEHSLDGFLITGVEHTETTKKRLATCGTPVVHMMDFSPNYFSVGFSQQQAGYAMGRHLISRGYRRPAYIGAQLDSRVLKRREGFRRALREANLETDYSEIMVPDSSSIELGVKLLDRLLKEAPKTDAVFCCNDDLAMGALFECQRRGIKVPEQLAIAGFNDLAPVGWTVPAITSVTTPRYQVGFEAAQLLLKLMNNKVPDRTRIDLGFRLAERQST